MPPKKSAKVDKNKQKQEEAERLAKEEEERRLKEEEEERKREEQRKKEQEERERLEAEERVYLEVERKDYDNIRDNVVGRIEDHVMKKKDDYEWIHYTSCSTLPLVTDERAVNTYISILKEQQKCSSLNSSLDKLSDLYKLLGEASKNGNGIDMNPNNKLLKEVINEELDEITLSLMEHSDPYIDTETFNLIAEGGIQGQLQYCLWGNVCKNPRLKNFTFKERNFNFDLPKPMLLADVAVRVIYTPHDFLSPLSKSYYCPTNPSTIAGSITTDVNKQEDILTREEDNKSTLPLPTSRVTTADRQSKQGSGESRQETPSNKESRQETPSNNKGDQDEAATQDELEVNESDKVSVGNGLGESKHELDDDEIDLRCYRPSGGVILLDLYTLPPQSKTTNEWTFTQVIVDGLKQPSHPTDPSGAIIPISISMSLPDNFYYLDVDSIQLAAWDEDNLKWTSQGLQDVSFNLDERNVSFKILKFSPLAIMSERYVNLPYQSWEIVPVGINHNYIHIVGGCVEITISVEKDVCTIIRPVENSILAEIINKPMSLENLISALTGVGYNFFPELDVDEYASRTKKTEKVEFAVYESMAMSCCGWAFQWNKFNSDCDMNKIVLSSGQCSSDNWNGLKEENNQLDKVNWKSIICTDVKSYELELENDSFDTFSDNLKSGETTHSDLYTVLVKLASSQTTQLMSETDPIHIHTIEKLLKTVKILGST